MAFDASSEQSQDDEQKQNQAGQPGGEATSQLSGGSGGLAGSGGQAGSGQASGGPTSSGSWTNLNSYLDANKDQAQGVGQAVGQNVAGQAQKAQGDLSQVQQGYQSQAPYQALNTTTGAQVDQAFQNPGQYANGGDTSQAKTYLNGTWGINSQNSDITQYGQGGSGPSWAGVQSEYGNASDALKNTQTESGRDTLLGSTYGQGGMQYNQGEKNFDQLLLNQTPENQTTLNGIYNQYSPGVVATTGLSGDLSGALDQSLKYNAAEQAKAQGFKQQAGTDFSNAISGLSQGINAKTSAGNAANSSAYQGILGALQGGNLNADQVAQLNANGGQGLQLGQNTYNVNADKYLSGSPAYTNATAASQGDLNSYQGLNALLSGYSGSNAFADQQALSGIFGTDGVPTTASAPLNAYNFNGAGFNSAVSGAGTEYGKDQAQAQALQSQLSADQAQLAKFQAIPDSALPLGDRGGTQMGPDGATHFNGPADIAQAQLQAKVDQDQAQLGALNKMITGLKPGSQLGVKSKGPRMSK